jgi:3-phenylpropionate/trans-cinnamate dioxygenase ferredoxin reductase subunit
VSSTPGRRKSKAIRRVAIVGAGDCGTRTALQLREAGFQGEIALLGEESEEPYERPALSKDVLSDDRRSPTPIASAEHLAELDIDWIAGTRAVRLDRDQQAIWLDDGRVVEYDRVLVATGARARRPAVPGHAAISSLRTAADASQLRSRLTSGSRLLVIGGGFIGLEVAASAVSRGCQVTVIEFAHRLMSRVVPAAVADVIEQRHRDAGVDLRCGVGIDRIESVGGAVRAELTDARTVLADVVIAGVGALPNTELAGTAGLTISNGIAVDRHLRTNDPNILAAGDCCSFPHPLYDDQRIRLEAWRNAVTHVDVAAANLLDDDLVYDAVPWFWSDQYELGLQIAGLHGAASQHVARGRSDGAELHIGLDNRGRIVSASGVAPGTAIARDIRLIELMIAQRATPKPTDLANPAISLRSFVEAD